MAEISVRALSRIIADSGEGSKAAQDEHRRVGRLRQWAINAVNKKFTVLVVTPAEKKNSRFTHKAAQTGIVMMVKKRKRRSDHGN